MATATSLTSGEVMRKAKVTPSGMPPLTKPMNSGMDEQEQLALLATDGMLVRRPILVGKETVLVGFSEEEWERRLGRGESSDGNAV